MPRGPSTAPGRAYTLDSSHDFSSGGFKGNVSAASSRYAWIKNADASYTTAAIGVETPVIQWTGSNVLALP